MSLVLGLGRWESLAPGSCPCPSSLAEGLWEEEEEEEGEKPPQQWATVHGPQATLQSWLPGHCPSCPHLRRVGTRRGVGAADGTKGAVWGWVSGEGGVLHGPRVHHP